MKAVVKGNKKEIFHWLSENENNSKVFNGNQACLFAKKISRKTVQMIRTFIADVSDSKLLKKNVFIMEIVGVEIFISIHFQCKSFSRGYFNLLFCFMN